MAGAIERYRIAGRIKAKPMTPSAPEDFALAPLAAPDGAGKLEQALGRALPYCLDFPRRRLLCTLHAQPAALLEAPFLYLAQYEKAEGALSLPLDSLAGLDADPGAPLLILSIGRCGSTLLARLLTAAGLACVSEPDPPTNLAYLSADELAALGPTGSAAVVRATAGALRRHASGDPAIKLRSQCLRVIEEILAALPAARPLFLLRGALPWLRSNHLAFGWTPETLANKLHYSLAAYERILTSGRDCRLIWYEDLPRQPEAVLAALLGRPPGTEAKARLAAILAEDAQAGTGVARVAIERRPLPDGFFEAFLADPRARAAREIAQRRGLERLWEVIVR